MHGYGVFATKAIPANVIVSFYPCDAVHNTQTTALTVYPRKDGLDLSLDDPDIKEVVNTYKFMLCPEKHLSIVANPRRRTNPLLFGHLINDGASDIFASVQPQRLKKRQLLLSLLLQYAKETSSRRNCRFRSSATKSVLAIVTMAGIWTKSIPTLPKAVKTSLSLFIMK